MEPVEIISNISKRIPRGRKDLEAKCKLCGSINDIEVHHVRKLQRGKSNDFLTQINMNRKQVPLCKTCHIQVHQGKWDGKRVG